MTYLSITGVTSDNKLAKYQSFELEADAIAHAVTYNGFSIADPGGNQSFWIIDMAAGTIDVNTAAADSDLNTQALARVRRERDALLAASDFTVLVDAPFTTAKKTNWKAYRVLLRNLPASDGFDAFNPIYPTKPV